MSRSKKRRNVVEFSILLFLFFLVVISLFGADMFRPKKQSNPIEISIIMREQDNALWANARLGMEQAAQNYHAELRLLAPSSANDTQEQKALLERELTGGTDAMVIIATDTEEISAMLNTFDALPPIIFYESSPTEYDFLISPDNASIGTILAEEISLVYPSHHVIIYHPFTENSGVCLRVEACEDLLLSSGMTVSIVNELENLSFSSEKETVIAALDPSSTQELVSKKKTLSSANFPCYGVGATSVIAAALERGDLDAICAWSEYAAGYLAIEQAANLALQKKQQPLSPLSVTLVRKEELYETNNQKLLFPVAK